MSSTVDLARASIVRRLPWLLSVPASQVRAAALALLALSAVLGTAGGTWDAAWHVTLRRETFWSPPHLLLYGGTTIALGAALLGAAGAWFRGKPIWTAEPGFALAGIGALVVIGAAPIDDVWHRTFGRDVDVWSFPHLVALLGGCGINIGSGLACRQMLDLGVARPRWVRAAMAVFLTALLWVTMFGLNWYTLVLARVRDSLEFPLLVSLIAPAVLIVVQGLWGRGGATLTAATYTAYVIAAHGFLNAMGFALLPFPPMVIVGAIAVDIILMSGRSAGGVGLVAGVLFVPLFLLAEAASLAWYPHPALPPPRTDAMLGYLNALAEHPWDGAHVIQSLPLLLLTGAIGGATGGVAGRGLERLLRGTVRSDVQDG